MALREAGRILLVLLDQILFIRSRHGEEGVTGT